MNKIKNLKPKILNVFKAFFIKVSFCQMGKHQKQYNQLLLLGWVVFQLRILNYHIDKMAHS